MILPASNPPERRSSWRSFSGPTRLGHRWPHTLCTYVSVATRTDIGFDLERSIGACNAARVISSRSSNSSSVNGSWLMKRLEIIAPRDQVHREEARITSVRVLGPNLSGKAAAFHAGLLWAVNQGFDIINLSLGTSKKDWALAFHEVCDQAYFSNSFIVTAANNVARASYPSLFASVASVACKTTSDPRRFHANPEPPTEFLARGIDVEVAWIGGTTNRSTGNSYAAPHIAALAALLRSKHRNSGRSK